MRIALIALAVAGFLRLFGRVETAQRSGETDLVRSAALNAALTCYAVEGAYPESLDYLTRHYGLRYDEDAYFVQYEAFASNQLPDIRVLERGSQEWQAEW